MFKKIFKTAISLIVKPSEVWRELNSDQADDHESFLSGFVYPFIGLITLAAFIGVLFTRKGFDLQIALKESISILLSMFGGFFASALLINELWHKMFNRERNLKLCQRFVGYSSSLLYCLTIVLCLLPEFFFLRILVLYSVYIVWEGAVPYLDVTEAEQLKFAGIASLIIVGMPFAIEMIIGYLMPGLKF